MDLTLFLKNLMDLSGKRIANRPLNHLKNTLFSPKRPTIYFGSYSIKRSYMDYHEPSPKLAHGLRPRQEPVGSFKQVFVRYSWRLRALASEKTWRQKMMRRDSSSYRYKIISNFSLYNEFEVTWLKIDEELKKHIYIFFWTF